MAYVDHPGFWIGPLVIGSTAGLVALTRVSRFFPAASERLVTIDSLRGVLALCVMCHHFFIAYQWKHSGVWNNPPTHLYDLMGSGSVVLFFMITGFLFFGKIKAVQGNLNLNTFFVGRVFRLMPAYLASVALIYGAALARSRSWLDIPIAAGLDNWLFFQSGPVGTNVELGVINAGVHWTLSYEWLFYFSLPVLARGWSLLRLQAWAMFLLVVGTLWMTRNAVLISQINITTALLAPFALGGLVSEVQRSQLVCNVLKGVWGSVVSIVALVLFVALCPSPYTLTAYLLLAIAFLPIAIGSSYFGLLRLPAMRLIGDLSYDIYLLHGIVIFLLFSVVMPESFQHASTAGRLLSLLAITSLCSVVLAMIVYLLVDRPFLALGKKVAVIDRSQELAAP